MTKTISPYRAARSFDDVQVRDALRAIEIRLGVSDIVAASIATRDFHPVHHNVEYARTIGHPTIFLNILTTNAYVERFVTEWAGRGARLKSITIKLGVPAYAGDTLSFAGEVTARAETGRWVDVAVKGSTARGVHVSGNVRIELA